MAQPLSSIPTELASLSNLLHLSYHRNKNQHRLSRWWARFSQLRRCLSKLETEIQREPQSLLAPSDQQALLERENKTKKRKPGKAIRESRVKQRVEFMQDFLIPKCYMAFGNLVADNQYAPLGLMLMACLARVLKVIEPLGWERDMERERKRQEEITANMDGKKSEEIAQQNLEDGGVDMGEKIERRKVLDTENLDEGETTTPNNAKRSRKEDLVELREAVTEPKEASSKKPKKKKRKKGGDAFDDLFSSLM